MGSDEKRAAEMLRAMAKRHLQQGADLIMRADELDPPAPVDHAVRSICGTCGTEYRGREYATGQRCESCDERGETGYLRRVIARTAGGIELPTDDDFRLPDEVKADEVRPLYPLKPILSQCDHCGRTTVLPGHDGRMCGDYLKPGEYCHGTMRPYVRDHDDEPLTTTDGRSLGVSRNELAASQAALDEAAEHWMSLDLAELSDRSDEDCLGIAATFAGRRG
jgi:hypothetical protein